MAENEERMPNTIRWRSVGSDVEETTRTQHRIPLRTHQQHRQHQQHTLSNAVTMDTEASNRNASVTESDFSTATSTADPSQVKTQVAKISYAPLETRIANSIKRTPKLRQPECRLIELESPPSSMGTGRQQVVAEPVITLRTQEDFERCKAEREQEIKEMQNMLDQIVIKSPARSSQNELAEEKVVLPANVEETQHRPTETEKTELVATASEITLKMRDMGDEAQTDVESEQPRLINMTFRKSRSDLHWERSRPQTTREGWRPLETSKPRSRSSHLPTAKTAPVHATTDSTNMKKTKSYDPEEARRYMEEQKRRRRSNPMQFEAILHPNREKSTFDKDQIKKNLEELRKSTKKILSKSTKKKVSVAADSTTAPQLSSPNPQRQSSKLIRSGQIVFKRPAQRQDHAKMSHGKEKSNAPPEGGLQTKATAGQGLARKSTLSNGPHAKKKSPAEQHQQAAEPEAVIVVTPRSRDYGDDQDDNHEIEFEMEMAIEDSNENENEKDAEEVKTGKLSAKSRRSGEAANPLSENHKRIGILRKPEIKDHSFSAIKEYSFDKENVAIEMMTPKLSGTLESRLKDLPPSPAHLEEIIVVPLKKDSATIQAPAQAEKCTQVKDSLSLLTPAERRKNDDVIASKSKERRHDLPYWLRPSAVQIYPYNFVVAVRRKLESIVNTPHAEPTGAHKISIQRRLLETPRAAGKSTDEGAQSGDAVSVTKSHSAPASGLASKPAHSPTYTDLSSNFSSISIQLPPSNTISNVSSLQSDHLPSLRLPLGEAAKSKVDSKLKSPKRPEVAASKSLDGDDGDDTTISSSVLNSPVKRATPQGIERRPKDAAHEHEHVKDDARETAVSPLSLKSIEQLKVVPRALKAQQGDKQIESEDDSGQEKSKGENENENGASVNFNKFLDDFQRSLTQVIEVNEQLKSTIDRSFQAAPHQQQHNDKLLNSHVQYPSDFEEEDLASKCSRRSPVKSPPPQMGLTSTVRSAPSPTPPVFELNLRSQTNSSANTTPSVTGNGTATGTGTGTATDAGGAAKAQLELDVDEAERRVHSIEVLKERLRRSIMESRASRLLDEPAPEPDDSHRASSAGPSPHTLETHSRSCKSNQSPREKALKGSSRSAAHSCASASGSGSGGRSLSDQVDSEVVVLFKKPDNVAAKSSVSLIRPMTQKREKGGEETRRQSYLAAHLNSARGDFSLSSSRRANTQRSRRQSERSSPSAAESSGDAPRSSSLPATPNVHAVANKKEHKSPSRAASSSSARGELESSVVSMRHMELSDSSLNYSNIGLYDQLIQSETNKSQQLTVLLKLREKSLLDRTKAQIALLQVQKERYRSRGLIDQIAAIKKKQRAILMKMDKERDEIKRLLQSTSTTTLSTGSHSSQGHQHSARTQHSPQSRSPCSPKRSSGQRARQEPAEESPLPPTLKLPSRPPTARPLRANHHKARETSKPQQQEQQQQQQQTVQTTREHSGGGSSARSTPVLRGDYQLPPTASLEELLARRESDLRRRREHVERLMVWHQRLDDEEAEVMQMEHMLLNCNSSKGSMGERSHTGGSTQQDVLSQRTAEHRERMERRIKEIDKSLRELSNIPATATGSATSQSSRQEDSDATGAGAAAAAVVPVTGAKLNKLWRRLTSQHVEKFEPTRRYKLCKADLERLYEEAKKAVLRDFALNEERLTAELLERSASNVSCASSSALSTVQHDSKCRQSETKASSMPRLHLNLSSDLDDETEVTQSPIPQAQGNYSPSAAEDDFHSRQSSAGHVPSDISSAMPSVQRSLSDSQIGSARLTSIQLSPGSVSEGNHSKGEVANGKEVDGHSPRSELPAMQCKESKNECEETLQSVHSVKSSAYSMSFDSVSPGTSTPLNDIPTAVDEAESQSEMITIREEESPPKSEAHVETVSTAIGMSSMRTMPSSPTSKTDELDDIDGEDHELTVAEISNGAGGNASSSSSSSHTLTNVELEQTSTNSESEMAKEESSNSIDGDVQAANQESSSPKIHIASAQLAADTENKAQALSAKLEEIEAAVSQLSLVDAPPISSITSKFGNESSKGATGDDTVTELTYSSNFENAAAAETSPKSNTEVKSSETSGNSVEKFIESDGTGSVEMPNRNNWEDSILNAYSIFKPIPGRPLSLAHELRLALGCYESELELEEMGDQTQLEDMSLPHFESTMDLTANAERTSDNATSVSASASPEKAPSSTPEDACPESKSETPTNDEAASIPKDTSTELPLPLTLAPPPPPPPPSPPSPQSPSLAAPPTTSLPNNQLMPDIINELETRRQQTIFESEQAKHYEQVTAVPYMYVREIPNKPPPPYVPPAHGSPMTTIFPSEERIKDITYRRTHEIYCELLKTDYTNDKGEQLASVMEEKITNIYERIILDICREYLEEHQEVLNQGDPSNFRSQLAFFNPPNRLQCIQESIYKEVRRCLAMDKTSPKRTQVYSVYGQRARRDHIGKIIIQEMYDEDESWCHFESEEQEVLELVIEEMINHDIRQMAIEVLQAEGGYLDGSGMDSVANAEHSTEIDNNTSSIRSEIQQQDAIDAQDSISMEASRTPTATKAASDSQPSISN